MVSQLVNPQMPESVITVSILSLKGESFENYHLHLSKQVKILIEAKHPLRLSSIELIFI